MSARGRRGHLCGRSEASGEAHAGSRRIGQAYGMTEFRTYSARPLATRR